MRYRNDFEQCWIPPDLASLVAWFGANRPFAISKLP
jgi:hypothetical protein